MFGYCHSYIIHSSVQPRIQLGILTCMSYQYFKSIQLPWPVSSRVCWQLVSQVLVLQLCSAPYAHTGPYVYGTSHTRILIWDAHTRMGQHLVPYKYELYIVSQLASCAFYFVCYISLHEGLQLVTVRAAAVVHAHICMGPGLKLGRVIRVIWVNQVTFYPGQVGLTHFIRYPGLTRILHCITCVDDGVWLW